jgi:hypothetical protein
MRVAARKSPPVDHLDLANVLALALEAIAPFAPPRLLFRQGTDTDRFAPARGGVGEIGDLDLDRFFLLPAVLVDFLR